MQLKKWALALAFMVGGAAMAQSPAVTPAADVNVFLGSSGDHGQLSPGANSPFAYMNICPQTYPHGHTGYEHLAKTVTGFTHNRFEGVGCKGSGGIFMVKPYWGSNAADFDLQKQSESASPGYYAIAFTNGLKAAFAVDRYQGIHHYTFPASAHNAGLWINLANAFNNGIVGEEHQIEGQNISGWIKAKTTCSMGAYTIYYSVKFESPVQLLDSGKHQLVAKLKTADAGSLIMRIAFSSTSVTDAQKKLTNQPLAQLKTSSTEQWNKELSHIQVSGDAARVKLFYSLLYRALQSPYLVSENDGRYRAIDGSLQKADGEVYHGWSVWDNYKTQLPLLSLAYPDRYQHIVWSLANLYRFGKKDYATMNEPANSVRTEHAAAVLLDAQQKGYKVDIAPVYDAIKLEVDSIKSLTPDKKLETAYDLWAFARLAQVAKHPDVATQYMGKAQNMYQDIWKKEFSNMHKNDVDRLPARGMYQGTVWQYRWLIPYDVKGLMALTGGEKSFLTQLDTFFEKDFYNHANEHDIQVPVYYNATGQAWKSQQLMHRIGLDTMVQYYFNTNERDIGASIEKIYNNRPEALLRTMDDDGGAMSSWFVLAACGMYPAATGYPVYYLNVPYFKTVKIQVAQSKFFNITVNNYSVGNAYIKNVLLNGKDINRTWLTHQEIAGGGNLVITASATPTTYGNANIFMTDMQKK